MLRVFGRFAVGLAWVSMIVIPLFAAADAVGAVNLVMALIALLGLATLVFALHGVGAAILGDE
jgi:hypothetical protein